MLKAKLELIFQHCRISLRMVRAGLVWLCDFWKYLCHDKNGMLYASN